MPRVLISYRREDSAAYAGRVYDGLSQRYGDSEVFMDISTLPPGVDFVEAIERAVHGCDAVLVMIGKRWLSAADAQSRRRLDNPEDFVRLEVSAALSRGVMVIPILVEGAVMPISEDLPDVLQPLARRNALELSDGRWQFDMSRLFKALDSLQPASPEVLVANAPAAPVTVEPTPASPVIEDRNTQAPRTPGWTARAVVAVSWLIGAGLAEALYFLGRLGLQPLVPRELSIGWLVCGLIGALGLYAAFRGTVGPPFALLSVAVVTVLVDAFAYPLRMGGGLPSLLTAFTSGGAIGAAVSAACGTATGLLVSGLAREPLARRQAMLVIGLAALGAAAGFAAQWALGWGPLPWIAFLALGALPVAVWMAPARSRDRANRDAHVTATS